MRIMRKSPMLMNRIKLLLQINIELDDFLYDVVSVQNEPNEIMLMCRRRLNPNLILKLNKKYQSHIIFVEERNKQWSNAHNFILRRLRLIMELDQIWMPTKQAILMIVRILYTRPMIRNCFSIPFIRYLLLYYCDYAALTLLLRRIALSSAWFFGLFLLCNSLALVIFMSTFFP